MALIRHTLPALLAALTLAACSSGRQQNDTPGAEGTPSTSATPAGTTPPAQAGVRPGTYAGTIPCADCEGIRYTLVLDPDSTYYLRTFYVGRDNSKSFDELGRWSSPPDAGRLTLSGPSERPTSFALHGDTLRMLGADGKPIDSKLNFDIVRSATAEPMQPKLLLRGMYRYAADAGTFTECVTRMALPVADEGENGALRSAYLKKRTAPDAEMLVTVEGHTTMRPRADGAGERKVLVVDKFSSAVPDGICGDGSTAASLENIHWRLVMLGAEPVTTGTGRREAQMTLTSEGRTVRGSGGCNGFSGPYTLDGRKLKFGNLISTKMACMDGMEVETGLFAALAATATYTITGEHLELFDAGGKALARFEAVHTR